MKAYNHISFLMFALCFLLQNKTEAQNIRGDTIFVAANNVVTVYFPSEPSKAELGGGQEGMYKVSMGAKKSLSVLALKEGAANQDLEITEGDRKHLFILSYKEGSTARSIDLSTKKILKERSGIIKKSVSNALNEVHNLYSKSLSDTLDLKLWEKIEAWYGGLLKVVEPKDGDMVKLRLEESRKKLQVVNKEIKYREAMKEGQNYYSSKSYEQARKAYMRALEYKIGDPQAIKYINLTDSAWTKDYIDKGDEANNAKKYILAKTYYQNALAIKADYPSLLDKFNRIKQDADPSIYKVEKRKGDEAMEAYDIGEAKRAYDSALSVRPGDRDITEKLTALKRKEEEVKKEEDKEAEYQNALAAAKSLADKASSVQEFDLAIKEYKRAGSIMPSRKFPEKKINELMKIKKGVRPI